MDHRLADKFHLIMHLIRTNSAKQFFKIYRTVANLEHAQIKTNAF